VQPVKLAEGREAEFRKSLKAFSDYINDKKNGVIDGRPAARRRARSVPPGGSRRSPIIAAFPGSTTLAAKLAFLTSWLLADMTEAFNVMLMERRGDHDDHVSASGRQSLVAVRTSQPGFAAARTIHLSLPG
jgi:hypothetical protein